MVSGRKRDRGGESFLHLKQRQIAATMDKEDEMFRQVIVIDAAFPLLCGFFVKRLTAQTQPAQTQRGARSAIACS
jgi:hypothetical protein